MDHEDNRKLLEDQNGKSMKYDVPPEGSLGLLALGHIGLRLWREKRKEHQQLNIAHNQKLKHDNTSSNE